MSILLSDFFDPRSRYVFDTVRCSYERVSARSMGADSEKTCGIAGIQKCGLAPFSRHAHFAALFSDGNHASLVLDSQRFDLAGKHLTIATRAHRRYYIPVREFCLVEGQVRHFYCRYFYLDSFREGWPDNDDLFGRIGSITSSEDRLKDALYVWKCRRNGDPVDYSLLTDANKRWSVS